MSLDDNEKLKLLVEFLEKAPGVGIWSDKIESVIEFLESHEWDIDNATNQYNSEWDENGEPIFSEDDFELDM